MSEEPSNEHTPEPEAEPLTLENLAERVRELEDIVKRHAREIEALRRLNRALVNP